MKYFFLAITLWSGTIGLAVAQTPILGAAAELPFTLQLEEATQDEWPGLHSFAFAQWEGWWVAIGGRVGGLHGFFPFTAFPEDEANANIWLLDPITGNFHTFPIANLNVPWHDPLTATNPQYTQDGAWLYIAGGYGKDHAQGNFITFPTLTAVALPELVSKMLAGENPSTAFRQIEVPGLRVCGGEMDRLGAYFYLVGGHDFSGNYTSMPSPAFTQVYSNEIRRFKIQNAPNALSVNDFSAYHDEQNLHRRDFSLAPLIRPDGSPALGLYGGVFRPEADLPYYNPVYIAADDIFELDGSYAQLFSQYTCPVVPLFDSTDATMYSIFFGGLSAHFWHAATQTVQYDEKVPFIRDITTLQRAANGASREFRMPVQFDELLGANMIFVPAETAPHYSNEVIKLRDPGPDHFVGYLFGGIRAQIPNITPSSASNRLFRLFITPKASSASGDLATPEGRMQVFPNPFSGQDRLVFSPPANVRSIRLTDAGGRILMDWSPPEIADWAALADQLRGLPAGVYFLQTVADGKRSVNKLLKIL